MAKPLTTANLLAALTAWSIPFVKEPDYTTRSNQSGWGSVEGFMVHHTGDDAPDSADLKIVRDGRAGLSGPLCNFGLADSGKVHLVAMGAANHAGGGDARVLRAMIAKEPLPASRYSHAQLGDYVDAIIGNPRFAGVECFYYAVDTPSQRAMMPRLAAAWIWAMNKQNGTTWGAERVIAHKEWQRGKIDPRLFGDDSMNKMRAEVAAYLKAGPEGVDELSEQAESDIREIKARVFGMLRQRYYLPNKDNPRKVDEVSEDTPGRVPGRVLDSLDGNYIALTSEAIADKVTKTDAKVEGLLAAFAAVGDGADVSEIAAAVDAAVNKAFDERVEGAKINMEVKQ
jgi:hypothetical protein